MTLMAGIWMLYTGNTRTYCCFCTSLKSIMLVAVVMKVSASCCSKAEPMSMLKPDLARHHPCTGQHTLDMLLWWRPLSNMELIQSLTTVMDKQLYTRYTKCYCTGIMQKEVPPLFLWKYNKFSKTHFKNWKGLSRDYSGQLRVVALAAKHPNLTE